MPTLLAAESFPEIDVDDLFARKKALVKDSMQLTEKESAVFWPLYDDYEKKEIDIFKKRAAHFRKYLQERTNLSDSQAKTLMNEYLQIEAEALKSKRALVKKFSAKLPAKRVYQYFVLEGLLEVGFFSQIAENLPPLE
jgi:hypothetical protein